MNVSSADALREFAQGAFAASNIDTKPSPRSVRFVDNGSAISWQAGNRLAFCATPTAVRRARPGATHAVFSLIKTVTIGAHAESMVCAHDTTKPVPATQHLHLIASMARATISGEEHWHYPHDASCQTGRRI
jgi:hypothetical protein